jgi:carbonic anhydrase
MADIGSTCSDYPVRNRGARRTRRGFLRTTTVAGLGGLLALAGPSLASSGPTVFGAFGVAHAAEEPGGISADEALKRLMDGNARYVESKLDHPDQTEARRTEVAKGQHPIAVVLGCADSRVPPEILFDQGLGDLFTVRVAGNVLDDSVLGSIEYALEHLGPKLVVVLGHERCGAVQAALELSTSGGHAEGHVEALVKAIQPAVDQAKTQDGGDTLDTAVIANVGLVVAQLKTGQPIVGKMVADGKAMIVGGRYDLDTGQVQIVA